MAPSCCSNSMKNMKYDRVFCGRRDCDRSGKVLVSRSSNNPGRMYYGCPVHGFVRWVLPDAVEDPIGSNNLGRRSESLYEEMENTVDLFRGELRHERVINWKEFFGALVVMNLLLLAAKLVAMLIWFIRA